MINDIRRLPNIPQLSIRLLDTSDIPHVTALRDEVLAQLAHPDLYAREDDVDGFVLSHIGFHAESRGQTLGLFDSQQLIAYAMLGLPSAQDGDNLGHHLTTDASILRGVAHIAGCMVQKSWRGNGLQRLLLAERFELAKSIGRTTCIAMVSLRNDASRRNLMNSGMHIGWVGTINGLHRQLLVTNLEASWNFEKENLKLVGCLDLSEQILMSAQGWWGIQEIEETNGKIKIAFARRVLKIH
jgi:GNAT superfamily N-acetyltransferase